MLTVAVLLAGGLSVLSSSSAFAYASNAGSTTTETRIFVTPDVNGNFSVPSGASSLSTNFNISMSGSNAAALSGSVVYVTGVLKNPSNQEITQSTALASGLTRNQNAFWSFPGVSGSATSLPTASINVTGSVNSFNISSSVGLGVVTASSIPSGTYNFEAKFYKDGNVYTPSGNDSSFISISYVVSGASITTPSGVTSLSQNILTCVNRSLVNSSDTLTINLVTSTSTSSVRYRFFSSLSTQTPISSVSTLSLSSVDLSTPIGVAVEHFLSTTANTVTTTDLSVTKGDGTEVSQACASTPSTLSAPTVSFTTSTTLTGSYTVSTSTSSGECILFEASDLNTILARITGISGSTSRTCAFTNLTSGTTYVVKVREVGRISFQESGQGFFLYRSLPSAFSSASASITSSGSQSNSQSSPSQTPEQIAAAAAAAAQAAAQAAAAVRAAEIATAQTALATVLKGDKAGTLSEYRSANINITTAAALTRLNAEVLKLSAADRTDFAKIKAIADKIEFDESFFNATARPTTTTYSSYGVVGVTERILPTINAKVLELPAAARLDVKAIQEIAKVESFVDRVANTETRGTVSATTLVEKGLLPATSPYKYSVVQGLAKYPEGSLNTMAKIEAAIKEQVAKAEAPKLRLAAIKAKIAARKK